VVATDAHTPAVGGGPPPAPHAARPTVELVFDTATFVRATTGRITAAPGDGVEISGDEDLGRAILGSLAFTI
ncbi:hypothetical protein M3B38_13315, partial [Dietzia cinnamea]|nr:hypothetical protein [Dietzia cinnamea]